MCRSVSTSSDRHPRRERREDPRTEQLRRQFTRFQQILEADQREAKLLTVEAQQISDVLTERLRENFQERLTSESRSVADPSLWRNFAASAAGRFLAGGRVRVRRRVRTPSPTRASLRATSFVWLVAAAFATAPARPGSPSVDHSGLSGAPSGDPTRSRLTRSLLALWRVVVGVATPLLAIMVIRAALT